MTKPLLSIGIIYKNEIRCLERCLKSLQPLREAIPCEVVMADTGADDGSRAVAERYADILIDFPWTGDFSAARNAVMDCCSGKWYMTIDCDEWVDPDITGYVAFLTTDKDFDFASVIIRNYDTPALDKGGSYSDFLATRLLRMSTGIRYEGTVHEHWPYQGDLRTMMLRGAVLHHDGYVYQNQEMLKAKQERNMVLLRKQLEDDPDNLIILNQCVESSANMPEQEGYLRRALAGVAEKWSQWELFGGPIYRHAVRMAMRDSLPELEQWIGEAEELFPTSIFLRVEIAYFAFGHYWNTDDYDGALRWGEKYLQGVADYHAGNFDRADLLASSLDKTDTHSRLSVSTVLASGYLHENRPEQCARLMVSLDPAEMNAKQIGDCVQNFGRLRSEFGWDTDAGILRFWERLREPVPDQERAEQRRTPFLQMGSVLFRGEYREKEAAGPQFHRPAYTVFLPLEGKCPLGDAAAILEANNPEILTEKLHHVSHWAEMPIQALAHALEQGAHFPPSDKPLNMEEHDTLVARLSQNGTWLLPYVQMQPEPAAMDWQELCWMRGLLMAAVRTYPWSSKEQDEEQGMALARRFARMEREFLPRCYAAEALQEGALFVLPPLHRFGWYCTRAFDALEQGSPVEYIRLLRAGLDACEGMTDMVEFLAGHTQEVRQLITPPELNALADQVRVILARFTPNDPAVAALKQSEAYQKVAHLIEGSASPVWGGLLQ